jgi:hypothetical protein
VALAAVNGCGRIGADAQWYRVIDANGIVQAHIYGRPDSAITVSDTRLTSDEARWISKLIARLAEARCQRGIA